MIYIENIGIIGLVLFIFVMDFINGGAVNTALALLIVIVYYRLLFAIDVLLSIYEDTSLLVIVKGMDIVKKHKKDQ